jgi:hypothetical protein
VRDVADYREPLIGPVGDDLHVQPTRLVARRRDGDTFPRRLVQVRDEVGVAQQIVDAVADVRDSIQAEEPCRRGIEPHDLVLGVENDAAVGERAGALADLTQQAVVLPFAVAGLGAQLVDAREDFRPKAAGLEQRHAAVAVERPIEQIQVTQRERQIQPGRAEQPPSGPAEPPAKQQRRREQRSQRSDL